MRQLHGIAIALAVTLVCAPGIAGARGQLQVRQTGVEIPAGARAARLVLANTGDAPIAAQIRIFAWSQVAGEDILASTEQLVASPAIVEIPPGSDQLVRVVRPLDDAPTREQAFRVVVDELPVAARNAGSPGVALRMRFLLPAFVRAADPAPAALTCGIREDRLQCTNEGGRAAQLAGVRLADGQGRVAELAAGLFGYVLAGGTRHWQLEPLVTSRLGPIRQLEAQLNGQSAKIALSPSR